MLVRVAFLLRLEPILIIKYPDNGIMIIEIIVILGLIINSNEMKINRFKGSTIKF
tara:strand:+ start:10501 stop:10665 length:165 start_codon:yes stop_codon:yes gene_type:complete